VIGGTQYSCLPGWQPRTPRQKGAPPARTSSEADATRDLLTPISRLILREREHFCLEKIVKGVFILYEGFDVGDSVEP
jgi:hypothetical protein